MNSKIECVSYLRTSSLTNTGSDKDSQSRQEAVISAYAKQHGYVIVQSAYDEGRSGADPLTDREGFSALLEYSRENKIETVLFETSSRYARDKDVAVRGFYKVEDYGITSLIDCEAGLDLLGMWNSNSAYEAILPFLKIVIAEDEKREVVRRLKSGREKKKAETGKCEGRWSLQQHYGTQRFKRLKKQVKKLADQSLTYVRIAGILAEEQGFVQPSTNKPFTSTQVMRLLKEVT